MDCKRYGTGPGSADVERTGKLERPDRPHGLNDIRLLCPVHNDGRLLPVLLHKDGVPLVVVQPVGGAHRHTLHPLPSLEFELDLIAGDHAHLQGGGTVN